MPSAPTPYANFRFRMMWDNTCVLGASKVSGFSRPTNGGQTEYGAIVIERGVSYDPAFVQWANQAFDPARTNNPSRRRRELTLEVYNEAGKKTVAYQVHRAWVSEFHGMSDLDGLGNVLVVESIVIQNEGWERVSSEP